MKAFPNVSRYAVIPALAVLASCNQEEPAPTEPESKPESTSVRFYEPKPEESPKPESPLLSAEPMVQLEDATLEAFVPLPSDLTKTEREEALQMAKAQLESSARYVPEFTSTALAAEPTEEQPAPSAQWQAAHDSVAQLNQFLSQTQQVSSVADLESHLAAYQTQHSQLDLTPLPDHEVTQLQDLLRQGIDAAATQIDQQLESAPNTEATADLRTRLALLMEQGN